MSWAEEWRAYDDVAVPTTLLGRVELSFDSATPMPQQGSGPRDSARAEARRHRAMGGTPKRRWYESPAS